MLRITIEKVPYGISEYAHIIHRGTIVNDGTGTLSGGNYRIKLDKKLSKSGAHTGIYKTGRVKGFKRKKEGAWKLLFLGLQDCLTEEAHNKSRGEDVMAVLLGRGGFDHWWYGIDEDIRMDIMDELNEALE
jgi:hypothetical protein